MPNDNIKSKYLKKKIENEEIKEYLIDVAVSRLQSCDVFTRTYGEEFASNKLKSNLCKVYTNEINYKRRGYANSWGKGTSTVTICCQEEKNKILSVEQIDDDREYESILLHEALHIILERTKKECIKTLIKSGTGVLEIKGGYERGRGLNEGLTNWIVRKTGLWTNSYQTLTNFIEELELAIGEDNVMAMGKGNISRRIPKLLKMESRECLRIFSLGDEIYELEDEILNNRSVLDITRRYLRRNLLNAGDREEVERQYKELVKPEASGEYSQEEFAYQIFLIKENQSDTPENRKDFFENQLQEKERRHMELKSQFESIIYEKYFKNEFEQVVKTGMKPNLPQLRKWQDLWSLITEEGVQEGTTISEFKQKYEEMRELYNIDDNISYNDESEEKSKKFRESMRSQDREENTEANVSLTKQSQINILGENQTKDDGLPR